MDDLPLRLGRNVKLLRDARGLTQAQMARLSGVPRATWAHLESGAGNPTLAVLHRIAAALQVSIEELISSPRGVGRFYAAGTLPIRERNEGVMRRLLPDPIPGVELDRIELKPRGRLTGVPHTPGTHEYLTVESGEIELAVAGERFLLSPGDVVAFRGDQRHSYANPLGRPAIGYSVVLLAPV
jgi:transcriptional regulator with XRE-family HTH domain